jgi:hypothetical protein
MDRITRGANIMVYVWGVFKNNKIIGYVRSESESNAIKIAKEKIIKNNDHFFLERVVLGNPMPENQDFFQKV